MIEDVKEQFQNAFPTRMPDSEELQKLSDALKIRQNFSAFQAEHLVLQGFGNGFFLKTESETEKTELVVMTPRFLDAPLFVINLIERDGILNLTAEFFEIQLNMISLCSIEQMKMEYESRKETPPPANWYDTIRYPASLFQRGPADETRAEFEEICTRYTGYYLEIVKLATVCPRLAKRDRIRVFSEELVRQGGSVYDRYADCLPEEERVTFLMDQVL